MAIIKNGKKYTVRISYKDKQGKYRSKQKSGFKSRRDAETFAGKMMLELHEGRDLNPDFISLYDYFVDWYETYKEPKIANQTKNRYRLTAEEIKNYFGDTPISEINRRIYQKFINKYGATHAKDTVHKVNSLIRACIRSAILDDILKKDFTAEVVLTYNEAKDKKVDYLNIDEIKQLVEYCSSSLSTNFTSKRMILTAIFTGARLGEISALTWEDINFNFKTISINKSLDSSSGEIKKTKTVSSNRIIRVNQGLLDILKPLKNNHNKNDFVFINQYGTVPTSNAVNKTLKDTLKTLDINRPGFHFHSLRHSHVAFLLANGIDIYVISKRLGHSSTATTSKVYAYLIDEYKSKSDYAIETKLNTLISIDTTASDIACE